LLRALPGPDFAPLQQDRAEFSEQIQRMVAALVATQPAGVGLGRIEIPVDVTRSDRPMKAVEWVRCLTDLRDRHGKHVFTVAELANIADASPAVTNVELGRLVKRGLIRRWVPGRYGLPEDVTASELAAAIDPDAYVTGAFALASQGYITQHVHEIDCFTRRRHNRSRRRPTPLGTLVFVCVGDRLHARPPHRGMAAPGQALCDLVFLLRRRGLDARSLYTFRKLDDLAVPADVLGRYPRTVQEAVADILKAARGSGTP
jgi:hypothetical protein